ncbi:alpha-1,6-mannosylglycoprotein 6-beta-N-acetylglucosaminyltransferase A-like isoform X1 [Xiphophorus couchianus]|nr:alpha-1,6-mannosylglycoprotein 6-beta-N-acetylglucosaminyltransferase A-like isoform X1 [Xiphophorus couchianus]
MRKLKQILNRPICVLLAICLLWCLSLPYFILTKVDQRSMGVTADNRLRENRKVWLETSKAQDVMKIFVQFVDDLLNVVKTDNNVSPSPCFKGYKEDIKALQEKMEAEKVKGQMKDDMIKELRADKAQLRQDVTRLEELLMLQLKKEEKKETVEYEDDIPEDTNCPLPPLDGFPECTGKIKWMKDMWMTDPCYSSYGVNGSLCSFLIYLSETESWCPVLPGRVSVIEETKQPVLEDAVIRGHFEGLHQFLDNKTEFKWIQQRIKSMEEIWLEAGLSLSAKYNLEDRKAKQILVHPGVLTKEAGLKIAENAFSGGPLGELVQWSDLISSLHVLGHHLHLSASLPSLNKFFGIQTGGCPSRLSLVEPNLIYTDIIGLRQIQKVLKTSWIKYKCIIRVLDSFGTEPDFNHADWAKKYNLKSPFGGLSLAPMQFYTMFPHTPDNTFLGFVVQHQLSLEENEKLKSTQRKNQALIYGKSATFWKGKKSYLDVIHKYLDIHGTVDNNTLIPNYVINHGIIKGTDVQTLLRQSKVFVGLSFPYEGPAPLEALANGCAFLNPRLKPPHSSLNTEFFKGKPTIREVTSQHPYAEEIGEPYVWMVDMDNQTDVERTITAILNRTIKPYLPYEFTCEGMLQRVNVLIEKQDLCSPAMIWPPLSSLQVVKAEAGTSCKQACWRAGLICEPAFFPYLNNANNLASHNIACQTSEFSDGHLVFPAYDSTEEHCLFQSDSLLYSCVRSEQSLNRICPCRDYIKDQVALCKACL